MPITIVDIEKAVDKNRNSLELWYVDYTTEDFSLICAYLNTHPEITTLTATVYYCGLDEQDVIALAATSLQEMYIQNTTITEQGAQALAANKNLKKLACQNMRQDAIMAIAASTTLISIRAPDAFINEKGAQALAKNRALKTFSCHHIDESGIIAIASASLKTLDLGSTAISKKEAKVLAANRSLQELTFGNIDESGIIAIAASRTLIALNLGPETHISERAAEALARNITLKKLRLDSANVDDNIAMVIAKNTTLIELELRGDDVGDRGAVALARNITLEKLGLRWTSISEEGAAAFAANRSLKQLDLGASETFGDKEAIVLSVNTTLRTLELSGCNIGNKGAIAFAANKNLRQLDLSDNNGIGEEGIVALAESTTINVLDVFQNNMSDVAKNALKLREERIQALQAEAKNSASITNISMMVLGGFIAAAGIAAVAIAFTLLNAATFGLVGLVVAGIGTASVLAGVGLFATGAYRNSKHLSTDESLYELK